MLTDCVYCLLLEIKLYSLKPDILYYVYQGAKLNAKCKNLALRELS